MTSELEFRRVGVVFEYRPTGLHINTAAVTRDRTAANTALRHEIQRRIDAFAPALADDSIGRRARLPDAPAQTKRWGQCERCGDKLPTNRGGDCYLCVAAVRSCLKRRSEATCTTNTKGAKPVGDTPK